MRRTFLALAAATGITVLTTTAFAAFPDGTGHRYASQIDVLQSRNIVGGYADGRFRPDANINRAEFLRMVMLASKGDLALNPRDRRCFRDFTGPEQWYWVTACAGKEMGIVEGNPDGTFRGERTVNLAEALAMSARAWGIPLPVYIRAPDHWYDPYIDVAASLGVLNVLPATPELPLTRGQAAAVLVEFDQPLMQIGGSTTSRSSASSCPMGSVRVGGQCTAQSSSCGGSVCGSPLAPLGAVLVLEQRSTGTGHTVGGVADVPLISFDVTGWRQDIRLHGLSFRAEVGSLVSATRYRLFIDTDGDEQAETQVGGIGVVSGERLRFSNPNLLLSIGVLKHMEVRADFLERSTSGTFALVFATSDLQYVEASSVLDGKSLSPGISTDGASCSPYICRIAVFTRPARVYVIQSLGNLFVTRDTVVPNRQVLLGERSDPLLRLKFRATGENTLVTYLAISGGTNSIDHLELWEEGGTQAFAFARQGSCDTVITGQFCVRASAGVFTVPRDGEKRMHVRAILRADSEGGVSGDTVTLQLTDETSPTMAVRAQGEGSQDTLEQNDGDSALEGEVIIGREDAGANVAVIGNTNDLVGAKFASIENSSPDVDLLPVPSGVQPIGYFRFRALANRNVQGGLNPITVTKLVFTVSAVNTRIATGSLVLYNRADSSRTASCSAVGTTGTIIVTCPSLTASTVNTLIGSGDFIDLVLRADVTPAIAAGTSTLQVILNQLGNRFITGPVEWNDGVNPFQWVDVPVSSVRSTLYRT